MTTATGMVAIDPWRRRGLSPMPYAVLSFSQSDTSAATVFRDKNNPCRFQDGLDSSKIFA